LFSQTLHHHFHRFFSVAAAHGCGRINLCNFGLQQRQCTAGENAFYWQKLKGTRITLQRLNRTAWASAAVNYINPKDPKNNLHIQIRHQFVRNPHYRIFVQGGVEEELDKYLREGRTVYTPVLGAAYALAELRYCGRFDFDLALLPEKQEEVSISSVLPLISKEEEVYIDYKKSKGLLKDEFPFLLDISRTLLKTITLLYPATPERSIVVKPWHNLEITRYGEQAVAWLPAW